MTTENSNVIPFVPRGLEDLAKPITEADLNEVIEIERDLANDDGRPSDAELREFLRDHPAMRFTPEQRRSMLRADCCACGQPLARVQLWPVLMSNGSPWPGRKNLK